MMMIGTVLWLWGAILPGGPEDEALESVRTDDLRRHIEWLADDAREGREAGSPGGHASALYIAEQYKRFGWEPGGQEQTYFQAFAPEGKPATLVVKEGAVQPGLKNVVAIRPGRDAALKEEFLVVGAHYDHVGKGWEGATHGTLGQIHNGADDNASGTSVLLEIAEALSKAGLKRTVILVSFDGEEKGLWGSKAFVEVPPRPLERCRWMINVDMAGRNATKDIAVGRGDATNVPLNRALQGAETKWEFRFDTRAADGFMRRSDQWNFHQKGVPSIFLFGKVHPDYHTERDDVERINLEKVQLISRIVLFILYRLGEETP
jgi:hypothetical protein